MLIAALIGALIPEAFLERYLDAGWLSLLLMLLVGIPLYICASASTPIAAALVLKGLSPGAALVFLLAGPATNAATITIVVRYWGRRAAAIYLAAIGGCSLGLGWLVNRLYAWWELDITDWTHAASADRIAWWQSLSAIALLLLIGRAYLRARATEDTCSCE